MNSMLERRRFRRLGTNLPMTLRYQGLLIPATATNISCGGACVDSSHPQILENSAVEIFVDLDSKHRDLSLRGDIMRVQEKGEGKKKTCSLGIRFTNLFSTGHDALQDFLRGKLN